MSGDHDKYHMKAEVVNDGDLRFTKDETNELINALEEAYEQAEVDRLRAKKKQIYEDLFDDINEWFECTPQVHSDTMQTDNSTNH